MKWLIYTIVFINLLIAVVVAPHVYYNFHIKFIYVGKPYVVEYPCPIMEGPGIIYFLTEPCGEIIAKEVLS